MEWYFIVLICIGYYIGWIITSIFVTRTGGDDMGPAAGMIWPIVLPLAIVMWFTEKYGDQED